MGEKKPCDISGLVFYPCLICCNHYGFSLWECCDSKGVVARCTLHDAAVGETRCGWHISDVY